MFKGVLFDWDGTLADTRKVILASFLKALESINVTTEPEFIERQIGTGAAQTFKEILRKERKTYDEGTINYLLGKKIEAEIGLANNVKLFPGARSLLEALQGKVKLALASMNNALVIEDLMNKMHIADCFNVVIAVENVAKFKPNPEIFLKAASKLNLEPNECVVVEDSIFGVEAARNGGTKCIAVLTGVYTKSELEKANPTLIVKSLLEKDKILNFILN